MERNVNSPTLCLKVDAYLSEPVIQFIEQNYYARINQQAALENLIHDEAFLKNPTAHVALFSDHGIVHVRDVAQQLLRLLERSNGLLMPGRNRERLKFMGGYGVMVAYLHDIGMRDFSAFGRAMHPEAAAQLTFSPEFDELVEMIWESNCGNVAWRLLKMACQEQLPQTPVLVLREMLALSVCHSKKKVPVTCLNRPHQFRKLMQRSIGTNLRFLYHQQQNAGVQQQRTCLDRHPHADRCNSELARLYPDFENESFLWLLSPDPVVRDLVHDVIDTLRVLRAADALRQRGTMLKTSAAHEIMVDHQSANAVYALRSHDDTKLFFIESQDPISAGEANLAGSELDREGNLRVAFYRGNFAGDEAIRRAAECAALIIDDMVADAVLSFTRDDAPEKRWASETLAPAHKSAAEIEILVEGVEDNPHFAQLVCQELRRLNPVVGRRSRPLPSLQNVEPAELTPYLNGRVFDWHMEERARLVQQIFGKADAALLQMDLTHAFQDTRIITLRAGEKLIEAGNRAGFVFIPLGEGLRVFPLGGYTSVHNPAYVSIGNTGVIRGARRNATVIAESLVDVLVIPKQVYLDHWYRTYPTGAIHRLFREDLGND